MQKGPSKRALLIAGPTASGKSALALRLARRRGGFVVNCDSMQVYRDLCVLTARPTPAEETAAPHRLYGHVDASVNYSAGAYLADAARALAEAEAAGALPIFVGGTGLYFKALLEGLGAVPPVPSDVRESVRARLAAQGPEALHAALAQRDPQAAGRLKPRDGVRIARALEVVEATGRTLAAWQRDVAAPPLLAAAEVDAIFLNVDRREVYARIDARFAQMVHRGALDEAAQLAARELDPLLPAMKAHGVPALIRCLAGEISRDEAIAIGQRDTRHYAKRQFTWFRHQLPMFEWLDAEAAERRFR